MVLLEIYQRFTGHFLNELHCSFKQEFLINSSVQIPLKLNYNFLAILQPFSEAATGGVPYSQENICGGVTF